jgi:hypothetical protein
MSETERKAAAFDAIDKYRFNLLVEPSGEGKNLVWAESIWGVGPTLLEAIEDWLSKFREAKP